MAATCPPSGSHPQSAKRPPGMTTPPRGTHRRPTTPYCTSRYIASAYLTRHIANPALTRWADGPSGDRADLPDERRPEHRDDRHRQEERRVPAELADQRRGDRRGQHLRPGVGDV